MKSEESEEPGSVDYNERLWRRTRNEHIIQHNQGLKNLAEHSHWSHQSGLFDNITQPTKLLFHQFEPHLIAADDKDGLTIWDWETSRRLNAFSNANPPRSRITDIKLLNEDDKALLLTGSSDGVVRLYRDYEQADAELVTSWRALSDLLPSNRSSGLVADWQQGKGHLLVGGDVKVIRVFDARKEVSINDLPARSGSCITSLTSDQVEGNLFAAGFGDGAVRIYDKRLGPRDAMIKLWKDHKAWVTNIHMQRGGHRELLSSCVTGEVKLWDLRLSSCVSEVQAHSGNLRSMAVHEHAPVFATGSTNHILKVWNMSGQSLSTMRHTGSGFLAGQSGRSSAVSALAFHPHRMVLASSGGGDSHIHLNKPISDRSL
jgi:regulator-associated protein of mTOR